MRACARSRQRSTRFDGGQCVGSASCPQKEPSAHSCMSRGGGNRAPGWEAFTAICTLSHKHSPRSSASWLTIWSSVYCVFLTGTLAATAGAYAPRMYLPTRPTRPKHKVSLGSYAGDRRGALPHVYYRRSCSVAASTHQIPSSRPRARIASTMGASVVYL